MRANGLSEADWLDIAGGRYTEKGKSFFTQRIDFEYTLTPEAVPAEAEGSKTMRVIAECGLVAGNKQGGVAGNRGLLFWYNVGTMGEHVIRNVVVHRSLKWLARVLFWLAWIANGLLSVWCVGAIWYQHWVEAAVGKWTLIGAFVLAEIVLMAMSVWRRWLLLAGAALGGGVTAAWLGLQSPTGQHDWDPPFARMPKATFSPDGKTVTIENVRDFHYRTEDDYDIRYRTETYSIEDLESLDYSVTYWNGNKLFGHISVSFGFKDGRRLVFSPEARLKRGKKYELLPGFFRQYEMIFVCATEEDAFQLRTNHRKYEQEELYLYPTVIARPDYLRFVFVDLMKRANGLIEKPEYYNGITYNCLSSFAPTAEKLSVDFFSGWRGPVNGISDRAAWDRGRLRRTVPGESFEDYKKRHFANQYVEHLVDPPNYSQLIRPDLKK